jgi:hypothetical protein
VSDHLDYDLAVQMLRTWGLRCTGGSLKSAGLRLNTGSEAAVDDEEAAMYYVESVDSFYTARPVLVHVYAEFKSIGTYRWRRPGETEFVALKRLRWLPFRDETHIPHAVHQMFLEHLSDKLREHPFVKPSAMPIQIQEQTPEAVVNAVLAAVAARYAPSVTA